MRRIESGHYTVEVNGQTFHVVRFEHWTQCDNPHPMRWRDQHGIVHRDYCEGHGEHPVTSWMVEDDNGREVGLDWPTRREALAALLTGSGS